ncbi:MAG: HRDC domain-containing protein [Minicystis sp.]
MTTGDAVAQLVRSTDDLLRLCSRLQHAPRLAVDVEANGLFAYRASLCVLQVAWPEDDLIQVAIIDPQKLDLAPLGPIFGPLGPIKVLHDLTFDARLLDEVGVPLARVRDTSVAARFLGYVATGLSSLLASELTIDLDKRFQQHDWARRPLAPEHLTYLTGDVLHLLALDDHLAEKADALDLAPEIEVECAYKLSTAGAAPRDGRPGYVRIKGSAALDGPGRAILRRLCQAREQAAEAADVPPFKVIGNEVLLEIARRRPNGRGALGVIPGALAGRAARHAQTFLRAVTDGLTDGDIPDDDRALFDPPRPDKAAITRRRGRESQVTGWRKAEAKRRSLDEQAILPGHCAQDLIDLLLDHRPDDPALSTAIAAIPGLGERRFARFGATFLELARSEPKGANAETQAHAPEPAKGAPEPAA